MKKKQWKLIEKYPVTVYKCGLRAGDRLRLRRDMPIVDFKGRPTGDVWREGEIWLVLPGSDEPPLDVWLEQPDGDRHTWSDDADIFEWFERVADEAVGG